MKDCIFCKIVRGEIPSKKAYEDETTLAFFDIAPQAETHVLVIPKRHLDHLDAAEAELDDDALAHLFRVAARVARELGLRESGYRLVSNCGAHACQTVPHLHLHILGGNQLTGRMG